MQTQHPADNAEYLSPAEAAALIGISRDTIKRWEKAGRISSLRTPLGHRRFRRSDVEKLLTGAKDGAASKAAS
jgi:excisionase family DNA binding protein